MYEGVCVWSHWCGASSHTSDDLMATDGGCICRLKKLIRSGEERQCTNKPFSLQTWHTDQRAGFIRRRLSGVVPIWSRIFRLDPKGLAVMLQFDLDRNTRLDKEPRTLTVTPLCTLKCLVALFGNRLASLYCTAGSFSGDPSPSSSFSEELLPQQQQYFKQPQQAERALNTPRVIPTGDRLSSSAERAGFQIKTY